MSLRDYFAGQVLCGMLNNQNMTDNITNLATSSGVKNIDIRAKYCYELADAMLGARAPKGGAA